MATLTRTSGLTVEINTGGLAAKRLNIHLPNPFLYFTKSLYIHILKGIGRKPPNRVVLGVLASAALISVKAVSPTRVDDLLTITVFPPV